MSEAKRKVDEKALPEFTMAQIEQHCTHDDLWIVYGDKVYDMTKYYPSHPGTNAMLRKAGKDATLAMQLVTQHSMPWKFIMNKLEESLIGRVKRQPF